jgi:hypothetical protein
MNVKMTAVSYIVVLEFTVRESFLRSCIFAYSSQSQAEIRKGPAKWAYDVA